jgi:hypothetical protein
MKNEDIRTELTMCLRENMTLHVEFKEHIPVATFIELHFHELLYVFSLGCL